MIGIVILNYFSSEDTISLYTKIVGLDNSQLRVLIVDNSADPSERQQLLSKVEKDLIVFSPENLGYTGGNNLGISRYLKIDGIQSIVILNPDIDFSSDIFTILDRKLHNSSEKLAVIGPRLCIRGEEGRIFSDGGYFEDRHILNSRHYNHGIKVGCASPPTKSIDFVNGSFFMMNVEAVKDIGVFDEKYFLYYEETDWCCRAREKGWEVCVDTSVSVDQRMSDNGLIADYYLTRNQFFINQRYGRNTIPGLILFRLGKIARCLIKGEAKWSKRIARANAMLRGMKDGLMRI